MGKSRTFTQSRGFRNSNPNRRTSPVTSWRKTLAAIGGVSFGTTLEAVGEGAGTVRWTTWSMRRRCAEVIQAPVELMFSVFVSSMNSVPDVSNARRKTGTWREMRGDRRFCAESKPWPFLTISISKRSPCWYQPPSTESSRFDARGCPAKEAR